MFLQASVVHSLHLYFLTWLCLSLIYTHLPLLTEFSAFFFHPVLIWPLGDKVQLGEKCGVNVPNPPKWIPTGAAGQPVGA